MSRIVRLAVAVASLASFAWCGCARSDARPSSPVTTSSAPAVTATASVAASASAIATSEAIAPPPPPEPPPYVPPFVSLDVAGFHEAVVSTPGAGTDKRPVMVAVHGLRGRADWTCRIGRHLVSARAFVVCPEGKPAQALKSDGDRARFTFASPDALKKEIDAAIAALVRAFPDRVDTTRLLYYGHSLGASFGVAMLRAEPSRWTRVVMSEGGWGGWWPTPAAHSAGQRVLFACGTQECVAGANASARVLKAKRDDVPAKVVYAEGAGHHSYGPIVDAMADEMPWLVAGDERFRSVESD